MELESGKSRQHLTDVQPPDAYDLTLPEHHALIWSSFKLQSIIVIGVATRASRAMQ